MRKLCFIIVVIFFACIVKGQGKLNIEVPYTDMPPDIDGVVDDTWDQVPAVSIDNMFQSEQPTVTAYWKVLWDYSALYVLVSVEDDDHWPSWVSGGNWWDYDQAELYLDVNEELNDGRGGGSPDAGTGHYQIQPNFSDGGSGVAGALIETGDYRPGGSYCYIVDGENYVFEYSLYYSTFKNIDGDELYPEYFEELDSIGFDVTIIDQDEGVTTSRQRAVWHNVGAKDECYNNMDDAGTITFVQSLIGSNYSQKVTPLSVYPNPVIDYMVVNAEFDKIIITDILGIEVRTIENSEKNINMEFLPSGIYIIQVFDMENSVGKAKIYKN